MANQYVVELPEDAEKIKRQFEKYANLTIGNGIEQIANSNLTFVAEKTRTSIEAIIEMVENTVGEFAESGINTLYESLHINEETINFARTVIALSKNATNLAAASILRGYLEISNLDIVNIPMSCMTAGLQMTISVMDIFLKKFTEKYQEYINMCIDFIVDIGSALTILRDAIYTIISRIEELIDIQCQYYLGMTLAQIKYYCRKGMGIYRQYKELKKQKNLGVRLDFETNPEIFKRKMNEWLNAQKDSLYNAFMVLQVKDALNDIVNTIKSMTDVNLTTLADNINSLDDLIELLDDLGLGDDSTAITLDILPLFNVNEILTSMKNLSNIEQMETEAAAFAMDAVNTTAGSYLSSAGVKIKKTYDILTDTNTRTITLVFYENPTKNSISKKIYKVLSSSVDSDGNSLFNASECKMIQQSIANTYTSNSQSGSGETTMKAGKYNIKIVIDIDNKNNESKPAATNDKTIQSSTVVDNYDTPAVSLMTIKETVKTAQQIDIERANKRRNTIALLHTAFSILKTVLPLMKELATLVSNYKTNKAFVKSKSSININTLYREVLEKLGFNKSIDTTTVYDSETGISGDAMYPVRTYQLYRYIVDSLGIIKEGEVVKEIDSIYCEQINEWIDKNDKDSLHIDLEKNNTLYIDYDSINEQINCINEKRKSLSQLLNEDMIDLFVDCDIRYHNGSFEHLGNVEILGNVIMFSDSSLPRLGSEIMMAQYNGW